MINFLIVSTFIVIAALVPILSTLLRNIAHKQQPTSNSEQPHIAKGIRFASSIYVLMTPILLTVIYFSIGTPSIFIEQLNEQTTVSELPENPFQAIAELPPEQQQQMIDQMVSRLEARLIQSPNDTQGWRRLARSHNILGNHQKSADAWREAIKRSNESKVTDWRGLAVALLEGGAGEAMSVDDELESALRKILADDAYDPLALFFLGVAARDKNQNQEAYSHWATLLASLPKDAPITPRLKELLASISPENPSTP